MPSAVKPKMRQSSAQADEREVIKPQEGPQEQFLRSSARVAFYGGAAGGG